MFQNDMQTAFAVGQRPATQEEVDQLVAFYDTVDRKITDLGPLYDIIAVHAGAYFSGDESLDEAVALIQSAATRYVNERR